MGWSASALIPLQVLGKGEPSPSSSGKGDGGFVRLTSPNSLPSFLTD